MSHFVSSMTMILQDVSNNQKLSSNVTKSSLRVVASERNIAVVNLGTFSITNSSIRSFSHDSLLALIPRSPTPEPARVEESFSLDYADEVGLNITSPYESDSEESEADSDILRLRTSRRPRQRPASPLGSYLSSLSHPGSAFSDDSEGEGSDTDWEPSMVEYTGGAELTPCFSRARPESTYSDDEYDGQRLEFDERGKSGASSSWEQPETFDWESRWQSEVDDGWVTDEGDTFDEGGVLPDEMDSDDFPTIHTWSHSWVWRPTTSPFHQQYTQVPSIQFHFVESLPPQPSTWTPLQDYMFGSKLTVPGHLAFNVAYSPLLDDHVAQRSSISESVEGYDVDPTMASHYDSKVGHVVVNVPSLEQQAAAGLFSVPSTRKRRRQRTTVEPSSLPNSESPEERDCPRGRSTTSPRTGGKQFPRTCSHLDSISEDADEDNVFVS